MWTFSRGWLQSGRLGRLASSDGRRASHACLFPALESLEGFLSYVNMMTNVMAEVVAKNVTAGTGFCDDGVIRRGA